MKIHIDFETASDVDLLVSGAFRYAEDPSTHPLIIAWCHKGMRDPIAVDLSVSPSEFLPKLKPLFLLLAEDNVIVCAHNRAFERVIIDKACPWWPEYAKPRLWSCTAARARLLALPGSLAGVGSVLGIKQKKDDRGKFLIDTFCKKKRVSPRDAPRLFQEFIEYCKQDVRAEMELDGILPEMPAVEARAFELDYIINDRGMPVDIELVEKARKFISRHSAQLTLTGIELSGYRPTQRARTLEWLEEQGLMLPNLQAETVEKAIKIPGLDQNVMDFLESRIELSRAGTKKLNTIAAMTSPDGRLRGAYLFSAATTRRWSSGGAQLHNLQKPDEGLNVNLILDLIAKGKADFLNQIISRPLSGIAQSIRGFFASDQGLLVGDYSSVEPRRLAQAAGEKWMIEAFLRGEDLYKIMAGKIFGVDPSTITKESMERFLGKQTVLGCGYGMGPPRFVGSCAQWGVDVPITLAETAVNGYRDKAPMIKRFWKGVENAAIAAVRDGDVYEYRDYTFEMVELRNGFPLLKVETPRGALYYPEPYLEQDEWYGTLKDRLCFKTSKGGTSWYETDTYGGSVTENLIQGDCRDVLRDGLLAANDMGHYVVGHVHDEGIAEGRPQDLPDFLEALASPDVDFPLKAEGYAARRYKK
jgi:DNA polymerase